MTMFGRCYCANAGALATLATASDASNPTRILAAMLMRYSPG
jgi:hypothetical protein